MVQTEPTIAKIPTPLTWREAAFALGAFLAVGIASLFSVFSNGEIFFPLHTDQINPWRADTSAVELETLNDIDNPVMSDKHFLFHPDNQVAIEAARDGELPLWNPYILGGSPYLGQALYGVFYPVHWLLLALPSEEAYGWISAVHVALAGFFTFLFLRRLGLSPMASFFGGIVFCLSGPFAARSHYYMTLAPVVWLPLILLLIDEALKHGRRWALWLIAPIIALTILSGFPQVAIYGAGFAVLWALFASQAGTIRGRLRGSFSVGCMIALGVGLSAIQIAPVLFAKSLSTPRIVDPEALIGQGLALPSFLTLVVSDLFGHPTWIHDQLLGNYLKGAYLPVLEADNFTETAIYAGILPLILALLSPLFGRGRGRFLFFGLALFALGFASMPLPDGAPSWLRTLVMSIAKMGMGDPKRMLLPAALFIACASAVGFDGLIRHARSRAMIVPLALLGALGITLLAFYLTIDSMGPLGLKKHLEQRALAIYGGLIPMSETLARDHFTYLRETILTATILVSISLVGFLLGTMRRTRRIVALLLITITAGDLLHFAYGINRGKNPAGFLRSTPLIKFLQKSQDEGHFRFARLWPQASESGEEISTEGSLSRDPLGDTVIVPNMGTHFHLHDACGYIVQVVSRYGALIDSIEPGILKPVMITPFERLDSLDSKILDVANIRFILTTSVIEREGYALVFEEGPYRVYENQDVLPRVACFDRVQVTPSLESLTESRRSLEQSRLFAKLESPEFNAHETLIIEGRNRLIPNGSGPLPRATIRDYSQSKVVIDLESGRDAYVYFADTYYPGWRAHVDGREAVVQPANGAFRAVHVPEGAKQIVFEYQPKDVMLGGVVSVFSLLLGIVLFCRGLFTKRELSPRPSP